jgi:molecular chaperone GrpE
MAQDKPEDVNPQESPGADRSDVTEIAEEAPDEAGVSDTLEQALEQITALKDQALRAQAETENVRRRAARDVENAHKYALEKFVVDLLPVLDSLEKAVESSSEPDAGAPSTDAMAEGVALSLKLFAATCERAGISEVDPHGEPFDPQLHEAIAMVPNPDAQPNSVMEVMQKGYTLNGRLVRAAKVVVVKAAD